MAGGVITAAWVQAFPVWVAGIVGLIGLNTWKRQQRGQRQLEHAERALASGHELFTFIRIVRDRHYKIADLDWSDVIQRANAMKDARTERLDRARTAWQDFQGHYTLTVFYAGTPNYDVSEQTWLIISFLSSLSELLCMQEVDTHEPVASARRAVSFRSRLFTASEPEDVDDIRDQLAAAEAALMAQLSPILKPKPWWPKALDAIKARWHAEAPSTSEHPCPTSPPPSPASDA